MSTGLGVQLWNVIVLNVERDTRSDDAGVVSRVSEGGRLGRHGFRSYEGDVVSTGCGREEGGEVQDCRLEVQEVAVKGGGVEG